MTQNITLSSLETMDSREALKLVGKQELTISFGVVGDKIRFTGSDVPTFRRAMNTVMVNVARKIGWEDTKFVKAGKKGEYEVSQIETSGHSEAEVQKFIEIITRLGEQAHKDYVPKSK